MNKALFLDRDGVININHGHVGSIDRFNFYIEIFKIVKFMKSKGFKIIIITNQAGIAKGYYTEEDFLFLTDWMLKKFRENNAHIDKVFYSPYHPTHGIGKYLKDDYSRKPNPGMLLKAKEIFNLDMPNSYLIGDKMTDILAGINANIKNNLILGSDSNLNVDNKQYTRFENHNQILSYLKSI